MKKNIQSDIEYFHDYDVHIPTRTIYLGGIEIDHKVAEKMIKALHILDNTKDNDKPITIILNNPGGDYYNGMGIFDAIKTCKNYVSIYVYGYCMSMASVILQAADERIIAPNARLMIHYGDTGYDGHSINYERLAGENKRINTVMEDIYLEKIKEKHPRFTRKKLTNLLNFDTFLSSVESVDLGLCDKIITSKTENI